MSKLLNLSLFIIFQMLFKPCNGFLEFGSMMDLESKLLLLTFFLLGDRLAQLDLRRPDTLIQLSPVILWCITIKLTLIANLCDILMIVFQGDKLMLQESWLGISIFTLVMMHGMVLGNYLTLMIILDTMIELFCLLPCILYDGFLLGLNILVFFV